MRFLRRLWNNVKEWWHGAVEKAAQVVRRARDWVREVMVRARVRARARTVLAALGAPVAMAGVGAKLGLMWLAGAGYTAAGLVGGGGGVGTAAVVAVGVFGAIAGLALYGVYRVVRDVRDRDREQSVIAWA